MLLYDVAEHVAGGLHAMVLEAAPTLSNIFSPIPYI